MAFYDEAPYTRGCDTEEKSLQMMHCHLKELISSYYYKVVLDIGCGCGRNLHLSSRHASTVVGVEYSKVSLKIARETVRAENVYLLEGNNLNLPFPDECANLVISDGVIHHTGNTPKAFEECIRVLKPGGAFYLSVYTENGLYRLIYHYVGGPLRF